MANRIALTAIVLVSFGRVAWANGEKVIVKQANAPRQWAAPQQKVITGIRNAHKELVTHQKAERALQGALPHLEGCCVEKTQHQIAHHQGEIQRLTQEKADGVTELKRLNAEAAQPQSAWSGSGRASHRHDTGWVRTGTHAGYWRGRNGPVFSTPREREIMSPKRGF
jgi:hypothetical protein